MFGQKVFRWVLCSTLTILIVFLLWFYITKDVVCATILQEHPESDFKATLKYDSEDIVNYLVWAPGKSGKPGQWRYIMLPGTELGCTLVTTDPKTGEKSETMRPGKRGSPASLTPDTNLDNYVIYSYAKMADGNYIVFRVSKESDKMFKTSQPYPMFSVWSPELTLAVLERQK